MGFINLQKRIVVIDAANASRAEDFLGLLRSSFGSLPVKPWSAEQASEMYFTHWLKAGVMAADFDFGDEVELQDSDGEGGIVRCRQHDLTSTEISTHLEHGKQVTKLGLVWAERLTFVVDHDLALKRCKPTDVLIDQQDKLVDASDAEKIDADFALLSAEIDALFPALVSLFTE